ncbi:pyocin knob domain-containing protein [Paenibacillus agaridevorans]|uniref:pyocin knob domain-containing protein n=1 Tax=Paenibacillus agaridevorans TaxID=171404 RepID=UPI001FE9E9AD|nr:pyocin knob domain-containing protein [Paenibacillus agaridevorans]
MQLTSNLNLKKPESTDNVNIDDLNGNADILDAEVTKLASTTEAGRMSAADKTKLNGIAAGAQVNTVNSVAGKTGAVALAKADVGLGNVDNVQQAPITHVGTGGAAHATATTSTAGFISASDQTKLNGIASGAQVNRPLATQAQAEAGTDNTTDMTPLRVAQAISALAPSSPVQSVAGKTGAVTLVKGDVGLGNVDNVQQAPLTHVGTGGNAHAAATTSTAGFLSASDKTKLDGIASGAQANRSIATQAQAEAGTDDTTDMTPLRTKQAIDSRNDLNRSRGAISPNSDFNNYTIMGVYVASVISNSPNRPPASADYGILEVVEDGGYLIQRYTEIVEGATFQRTHYDGSNWSPWRSAGGEGTLDVIKSYPLFEGKPLTPGAPVNLRPDGTVKSFPVGEYGAIGDYPTTTATDLSYSPEIKVTFKVDNTTFLGFEPRSSGPEWQVRVIKFDANGNATFGTPVAFNGNISSAFGVDSVMSYCAVMGNGNIALVTGTGSGLTSGNITLYALTISGTTITIGSPHVIFSWTGTWYISRLEVINVSSTSLVVNYSVSGFSVGVVAATYSGRVFTAAAPVYPPLAGLPATGGYFASTLIAAGKLLYAVTVGTNNYVRVFAATLSGTTLSFGNIVQCGGTSAGGDYYIQFVQKLDDNRAVVSYGTVTGGVYLDVVTVSGTTSSLPQATMTNSVYKGTTGYLNYLYPAAANTSMPMSFTLGSTMAGSTRLVVVRFNTNNTMTNLLTDSTTFSVSQHAFTDIVGYDYVTRRWFGYGRWANGPGLPGSIVGSVNGNLLTLNKVMVAKWDGVSTNKVTPEHVTKLVGIDPVETHYGDDQFIYLRSGSSSPVRASMYLGSGKVALPYINRFPTNLGSYYQGFVKVIDLSKAVLTTGIGVRIGMATIDGRVMLKGLLKLPGATLTAGAIYMSDALGDLYPVGTGTQTNNSGWQWVAGDGPRKTGVIVGMAISPSEIIIGDYFW